MKKYFSKSRIHWQINDQIEHKLQIIKFEQQIIGYKVHYKALKTIRNKIKNVYNQVRSIEYKK